MSSEDKMNTLHNRVEHALKYCEAKEDSMYKELAIILNNLKAQNIEMEVITAIEDLYIQKGILYCETAFEMGFNAAQNPQSLLTS